MTQETLRQRLRLERLQLPGAARKTASERVCERLAQLSVFRRARRVAAYHAVRGELDLAPLLQWVTAPAKHWYLPVIHPGRERTMRFVPYDPAHEPALNRYGIPEPDPAAAPAIRPQDLDLVLLPLVAFDAEGRRIGMGAGYYDRAFQFLRTHPRPTRPLLIGVGYSFQRVDKIEPQPWDVTLDCVVSANGLYGPLTKKER